MSDVKPVQYLLDVEEKTEDVLRFFIQQLHKSAVSADLNENLYYTAECLFRLKAYPQLQTVLAQGKRYAQLQTSALSPYLQMVEAKYLSEQGNFDVGVSLLEAILKTSTDKWLTAEAHLALADIYRRKEQWPLSFATYHKVYSSTKDTLQTVRAFNGIGSCHLMCAQFDSARYYYAMALETGLPLLGKSHTRIAQVQYNLGLIANREGDYYTAEQKFTEALPIYLRKLGSKHIKTAEIYGALGSVYLLKDDLEKALLYLLKERDILMQLYSKGQPDLINSYLNIGKVYYYQKEWNKADIALQKAMDLSVYFFGKKHQMYLQSVVEWSRVQVAYQQYDRAKYLLEELASIHRQHPDDYLADVYMLLGNIDLEINALKQAELYFNQANSLYELYYGERNVYSIEALVGISEVYLRKEQFDVALQYAKQALQRTKRDGQIIFGYDYWECQLQLLRCYGQQYKTKQRPLKYLRKDIALIKKTLEEAEKIRQTYFSTGSRMYYAEKMTALNELGLHLLTQYYPNKDDYFMENCWFFAENNKANILRYTMDTKHAYQLLPENVQQQLEQVVGKWNYFMIRNENEEEVSVAIRDSIVHYQSQYEALTKAILLQYPNVYARIYQVPPITLSDVQKAVKKDEVYINYFADNENYYHISVSRNNKMFKQITAKKTIDSMVQVWRGTIEKKGIEKESSGLLAAQLLPSSLPTKLIISTDGALDQLAFDALRVGGQYLVIRHPISYALSAATYFYPEEYSKAKSVIGFFPDFSNSSYPILSFEKEDKALSQFPSYKMYKGKSATAQQFMQAVGNAVCIHIATHLETDSVSPLQSKLVMQPGSAFLTINDIMHLKTSASLVSLAACRSNFGKMQSGEGILNFAWAFRYAGASEVLLTQWNASDKATAIIMQQFYHHLSEGKTTEVALQRAKVDYLKQTDAMGAKPFYWANFQLMANADATYLPTNSVLIKYAVLLFLFLIICYLAYILYSKRMVNATQ